MDRNGPRVAFDDFDPGLLGRAGRRAGMAAV